jgi:magnesium transporter
MKRVVAQDNLDDAILDHIRRDFIILSAVKTVGESLSELRSRTIGEKIVYFYVNDADGRLVGVVPTRRLLMSDPAARNETIMVGHVVAVPASATVLVACELLARHRLLALPVVDANGKMLGVVDITMFTEELSDVAERHAAEDAFQLIGIKVQSARERSPWIGFRYRFPWLLCNIAGGILCAILVGRYEVFLDSVIVLALFIPVVLNLAESVSIQSTTITLQGLHHRRTSWSLLARALRREFVIAGLLGLGCGGLVALIAGLWKGESTVAFAIGVSIALSMVTACLLGIVLPMGVRAMRGDPRIASGPMVLAAADIATLALYFSLAAWMLGAS